MVEPVARIRLYQPEDKKLVQFIIGKDDMEALAVANKRAYFHPLTLAIWIGLSCIFAQVVGWLPKPEHGYLGYLSPLPAFASMAVPIMFLCDWLNRPTFEDRAQDDLRRPDLVDIPSYYSRSPSSGLWILELGDKFVGLIALDASSDSTSTETISTSAPPVKTRDGKVKYTEGTSSTATIRHFYVEELYRPAGIQHDLLTHAVRMAFSRDPKVQTIRASDTPLKPYVSEALRQARFQLEAKTEKVGMLRWQNSTHILRRKGWKS
ncbi:predicted protein [Postia placenta Mad-698-R]|nr:predicted protein [Postia placenta Mad-698-R]